LEEDAIDNFNIAENQEGFGIPLPDQLDIPIANEPAESFEIVGRRRRYIKKYNTDFEEVQIRMKTMPDNASPVDWVKNIFDELVRLMLAGCAARNDMVSMDITSANAETRSVFVPMRRTSQLSATVVTNILERILQSGKNIFLEGPATVNFLSCEMPVGSQWGRSFAASSFETFCRKKSSIITIKNEKDNLCLARASSSNGNTRKRSR